MKGKNTNYLLALALVAICGHTPISQAIPINSDTLNYQGALFTLEGEWDSAIYRMTYWANFDEFEGTSDQSYLKALDWKWEGSAISSVSLLDAPGGTDAWMTQTFHQIGVGESVGCKKDGGSSAVCSEFVGSESPGLSTATEGDLSWVFEITFKSIRQVDVFLGDGLRTAYINAGGSLVAPVMTCGTATDLTCASDTGGIGAQNVPVPGVPVLLVIGLAGLALCRTRGNSAVRT